jgi:DNA modification methylase
MKKPYYQHNGITIYHGDCLEIMPQLEPVDLVVTDPPYGDGVGYGRHNKTIVNNEDVSINFAAMKLIGPILKKGRSLYIFTNWKAYPEIYEHNRSEAIFKIKMLLVIVKNNFGLGYGFRNQYELCVVMENEGGGYITIKVFQMYNSWIT